LTTAPELVAALPEAWNNTALMWALLPTFVGSIYRVRFTGNTGALKEPQIEVYLNGKNPSLLSPGNVVATYVFTDGQQGESKDYFADHCDGVTATVAAITNSGAAYDDYVALSGLSTAEIALLKACLGDADGDATNNVDTYNWDYGTAVNPHLIKLVRTVTSYMDGGYYAALYWHSGTSTFRLVNPFVPPDGLATDTYDIYTTKGTLGQTSPTAVAVFGYGQRYLFTANSAVDTPASSTSGVYAGSVACEAGNSAANVPYCVNYGDLITVLDFTKPANNPPYINLYTVKRAWTRQPQRNSSEAAWYGAGAIENVVGYNKRELQRGLHRIEVDLSLNWGGDESSGQTSANNAGVYPQNKFSVYKFTPHVDSTYTYVAACSNRGICNYDTGVCQCFPGYTSDACNVQNSLAL